MNLKKILKSYLLLVLIVFCVFVYLSNIEVNKKIDVYVVITFFINGLIILFFILKDSKPFSLNKIFWYFNFFFMFLAPLFQYLSDYKMWGFYLNDLDYTKTNIVLMFWFIIYGIFYNYKIKNKYIKEQKEKIELNLSIKKIYILIIFSFISLFIMIYFVGFNNLFIRDENSVDIGLDFISTIINNCFRIIPVYGLIYAIYYYKEKRTGIKFIILFGIMTFILNYPVSTTRYWSGAVYIGIAIVMFKKYIKDRTFDIGMILVFAILFPIFQLFKWYDISDILNGEATKNLINVYNNADFDAYSMLARAFYYVGENSIVYGKQLLTTIFFFIPRMFWVNKSVPTGELIASSQNQNFTNLACPVQAEAYVNFGYIGIVFYAIILSIILKKIDNIYWNKDDKIRYIDYVYPFLLGLLIFLLRGAFHPAMVYIFTFYLPLIIIKFFDFNKNKKYNKSIKLGEENER